MRRIDWGFVLYLVAVTILLTCVVMGVRVVDDRVDQHHFQNAR